MGLSNTIKCYSEVAWVAVGDRSSVVRVFPVAVLGLIPDALPAFFSSSSWLTDVDGMNDLWCSSIVLAAINTNVNGRVCGALVYFGCHQHGRK